MNTTHHILTVSRIVYPNQSASEPQFKVDGIAMDVVLLTTAGNQEPSAHIACAISDNRDPKNPKRKPWLTYMTWDNPTDEQKQVLRKALQKANKATDQEIDLTPDLEAAGWEIMDGGWRIDRK